MTSNTKLSFFQKKKEKKRLQNALHNYITLFWGQSISATNWRHCHPAALGRPYNFSSPTADCGRGSFFSQLHDQDDVTHNLTSSLLACHVGRTHFICTNSLSEDTIATVRIVGQAIGHSTGSADPSLMG